MLLDLMQNNQIQFALLSFVSITAAGGKWCERGTVTD